MAEMLHTTQQRQEEKQQQGEHQKDDYDEGGKRPGLCVSQAVYILWGKIEKLSSILVKCLTIKLVTLSLVLKIAKGIILGFLYQCCLNIYWEFVTVCY